MNIYPSLKAFLDNNNVTLVAVSKTQPATVVQTLYDQGQRVFGENRVQELCDKKEQLPNDIQWHLIGHLQKNKVKYIAPFIEMIHSIDSLDLLEKIDKEAAKNDRIINVLLQVKIAQEESKFGLNPNELIENIHQFYQFKNVRIQGLMGMGTFTNDITITEQEFEFFKNYFNQLSDYIPDDHKESFTVKSLGMSGDYKLAVEYGSNMVRIGSLLF